MIQIEVDQVKIEEIYREMVAEKLESLSNETVYWDTKELKRQAQMSWNTIQKKFFFDPNFPKFKADGHWRFPARECKAYLENWWKTQERS